MGEISRIAEEVLRILNCPFTTSLKTLCDIFKTVRPKSIQLWADLNDCQIEPLASVVLEGLLNQPTALEVISKSAHVVRFRDALIHESGAFLPSLLEKARRDCSKERPYVELCAKLLSSPLPKDVAIPICAHHLLLRLFEEIATDPCLQTFRLTHSLMNGIGNEASAALPLELLSRSQDSLVRTMRTAQDHSVHLHCLAILAQLAKLASEIQTRHVHQVANASETSKTADGEIQNVLSAAQNFFNFKRASKTLQLVVLRSICCSSSCEFAINGESGCLSLVLQVVDSVEVDQKRLWAQGNSPLLTKLFDRALRLDVGVLARLELLRIAASLAGRVAIPETVTNFFVHENEQLISVQNYAAIHHSIISGFPQALVTTQLLQLLKLSTVTSTELRTSFHAMKNGQHLLQSWLDAMKESHEIRASVVAAISSGKFSLEFQELIVSTKNSTHEANYSCLPLLLETRDTIRKGLCRLIITASFCALEGETRIDQDQLLRLLTIISNSAAKTPLCMAFVGFRERRRPDLTILEDPRAVSNFPHSDNWRSWLAQELTHDANDRHQKITSTLGEVFKDWELRCHNVEKPLQEERAKYSSLLTQLKQSKELYAQLHAEQQEQGLIVNGLESDNTNLRVARNSLEHQIDTLTTSIDQMQAQFEAFKRTSATDAEASKTLSERRELELLASHVAKDEMIESKCNQLAQASEKIRLLKDDATCLQGHLSSERTRLADLEASCKDHEQQESELRTLLEIAEETIGKIREVNLISNTSLACLQSEFDTLKLESLRTDKEQRAKMCLLESEISEVRHQGKAALSDESTARNEECNQLRRKIFDLERCNLLAEDETNSRIQDYEARILKQTCEIGRLEKRNKFRAKEFAQAQELSKKLMAVMQSGDSPASYARSKLNQLDPLDNDQAKASAKALDLDVLSSPVSKRSKHGRQSPVSPLTQPQEQHQRAPFTLPNAFGSEDRHKPLAELDPGSQKVRARRNNSNERETRHLVDHQKENRNEMLMNDFTDLSFGESVIFTSAEGEDFSLKELSFGGADDDTTFDFE